MATHKTKIVATMGPASESAEMLTRLIRAGLNVARLNVSHGDFDRMASVVEHAQQTVPCDLLLVPTRTGTTARMISRTKPAVWIAAPSPDEAVRQGLAFPTPCTRSISWRNQLIGANGLKAGRGKTVFIANESYLWPARQRAIPTPITASN